VLWSIALVIGAATIPVYGSETAHLHRHRPTTYTHPAATTLVEVNGSAAWVIVAIPLAASLLVAIALLRPRTGWVAFGCACVLTGLVGLSGLAAILTVGLAILPVAMLLAAACALDLTRRTSSPAQPPSADPSGFTG
jgi:hypothetical protein